MTEDLSPAPASSSAPPRVLVPFRYPMMMALTLLIFLLGAILIGVFIWYGQSGERLRNALAPHNLIPDTIEQARTIGWTGAGADRITLLSGAIALTDVAIDHHKTLRAGEITIDGSLMKKDPTTLQGIIHFFRALTPHQPIPTILHLPTPVGTLTVNGSGHYDPDTGQLTLETTQENGKIGCLLTADPASTARIECDLENINLSLDPFRVKRLNGWISFETLDNQITVTADLQSGAGQIVAGSLSIPMGALWLATLPHADPAATLTWTGKTDIVLEGRATPVGFNIAADPDASGLNRFILSAESGDFDLSHWGLDRFLPQFQITGRASLILRLATDGKTWALLPASTLTGTDTARIMYAPDDYPAALTGDSEDIAKTRAILTDYTIDRLRIEAHGPVPGRLEATIQSLGTNTTAFGDQPIQLNIALAFNPFE